MSLKHARIWLPRGPLRKMELEATARYPLETGGVLVGYWEEDEAKAVVKEASGPGPMAVHEQLHFVPDYDFQDEFVRSRYLDSNRVYSYLGDWHTHPNGASRLSPIDRRTLRRISRDKDARAERALMAILAGGPADWHISIWIYVPCSITAFNLPGTFRTEVFVD